MKKKGKGLPVSNRKTALLMWELWKAREMAMEPAEEERQKHEKSMPAPHSFLNSFGRAVKSKIMADPPLGRRGQL